METAGNARFIENISFQIGDQDMKISLGWISIVVDKMDGIFLGGVFLEGNCSQDASVEEAHRVMGGLIFTVAINT